MASGIPTIRLYISALLRICPIFAIVAIHRAFTVYNDNALPWLVTAFAWRYFRFFVFIYATIWRYINPKKQPQKPGDSKTVTIIIPTVSDHDNEELKECIATCLQNEPKAIIISTDFRSRAKGLRDLVRSLETSGVKITVLECCVTSKRKQMVNAVNRVTTPLVAFIDDHVFLPRSFLRYSVPEFENKEIGICATKKKVRLRALLSVSVVGKYWERFWNFLGMVYLERHNYEIQATHAMDGGMFVVSARAFLIRSSILQEKHFQHAFLNEYILGISGPVDIGDDNFITTWILTHGWKIAISFLPIVTTLGESGTFLGKVLRWRRTTLSRPNIIGLWELWWYWPWTLWTAHIPSLSNFALIWDFGMLYSLTKTQFYLDHAHQTILVASFAAFIYFSKVVKLLPHFQEYPLHFFLFFFPIPAYAIFAWLHTGLSIYAYCTILRYNWSGRNFLSAGDKKGSVNQVYENGLNDLLGRDCSKADQNVSYPITNPSVG